MPKRIKLLLIVLCLPVVMLAQLNVDHHIRKGIELIVESKYHYAVQRFNTVIQFKPDSWEAYFLRGVAKFYLDDTFGASRDFSHGIAINPFYSELYMYRGYTYQKNGDISKANADYDKAIELDPANPSIYVNKGIIQAIRENYSEAIPYFDEAISIKSDFSDAYLYKALCNAELEQYEVAEDDFKRALKLNRFDERVFIWRAYSRFKQELFETALEDLNMALRIDEQNLMALNYRAMVNYELEHYPEAIADLDSVVRLNPSNARVLYNRAILYEEIGAYDDAIEDYLKVSELNPENILAHFNRAMIRHKTGDLFGAVEDYSKALTVYDQFYWAYVYRAQARRELNDVKGSNSDFLTAERVKKENHGSEFGDTTKFKVLMGLNDEFIIESEKDRFSVSKLVEDDNTEHFAGLFYISLPCPGQKQYYSEYQHRFKKEFAELSALIFTNEKCFAPDSLPGVLDSVYQKISFEASSYFLKGLADGLSENYNSAIENLDAALAKKVNLASVYFNRSWMRYEMVELMKSFENFSQDVSVFSKNTDLNKNVKTNSKVIYDDYYTVLEDLDKVIALEPKLYYAYYNKGTIECKLYKYADAIGDYNKAIELNNEFAEAYFNRGLTYVFLSDSTAACADLSRAGELGMGEVYPLIRKYCKGVE